MNMKNIKFIYFGGEPIGVPVLEELEKAGILPSLIVCNPDQPVGRKQTLTPPPVKVWAEKHDIETFQPEDIKEETVRHRMSDSFWDLFIVVAYNHIFPKWLIELPKHGALNVHPSLLPLLRGASPIRSAILADMRDEIGVSIMVLDEEMDHGPIVAQKKLDISKENWPMKGSELDEMLGRLGGDLLAAVIPPYVSEEFTPQDQEHEYATYCSRLERSMGKLTLDPYNLPTGDEAYQAFLKIRAFDGYPETFFIYQDKRVKINDAKIENDTLKILSVTPEGKPKQSFDQYLTSLT